MSRHQVGIPSRPEALPLTRFSLAFMETFLGLAHVFRKFRLQLYETDRSDVLMAHDFFLPSPKLNTNGVRVKVVEAFEK